MRQVLTALLGSLLLTLVAPASTATTAKRVGLEQSVVRPVAQREALASTFQVDIDFDPDGGRYRVNVRNRSDQPQPAVVMVRPGAGQPFVVLDLGRVPAGGTATSDWLPRPAGAPRPRAFAFDPERDAWGSDARLGDPTPLADRLSPMTRPWVSETVDMLRGVRGTKRRSAPVSLEEAVAMVATCVAAGEGAEEALRLLVHRGQIYDLRQFVEKLREVLHAKGPDQRVQKIAEVVGSGRWAKLFPRGLIVLDSWVEDPLTGEKIAADTHVVDPVTGKILLSDQLKTVSGWPLDDDNLPKALNQLAGTGGKNEDGAVEKAGQRAKKVATINIVGGDSLDWTVDDLIAAIALELAGKEEPYETTPLGEDLLQLLRNADDIVLRSRKELRTVRSKAVLKAAQRTAARIAANRVMTPAQGPSAPAPAPAPTSKSKEESEGTQAPAEEQQQTPGECKVLQPGQPERMPGVGRAPWGPLQVLPANCGEQTDEQTDQPNAGLADALTQPGGVDFSSLGLRYLALGEGETEGVDFAFHADRIKGRSRGDGLAKATQASDAFFVWLALKPSVFRVNLKPNERDQIMDRQFARTEAGRILLEADLALKKKSAWIIHPRTALGRRFWDAIGANCVPTFRLWITPGIAKVREDGDSLYILDAPLKVKMARWEYRPGPGDPPTPNGVRCAGQPSAVEERVTRTYRRMVLPALTKAVNKDKEFADLRRVYLSRVAAEWYRERSKEQETRFAGIIDSGNIKRWVADDGWRPIQTFRKFLRSWTQGEYTATVRSNQTYRWSVTVGGVDFGHVGQDDVGAEAFQRRWGDMDDGVRRALANGGAGTGGGEQWLGGRSRVDPQVLAKEFPSPSSESSDDGTLGMSTRQLLVIALVGGGLLFVGFGVVRAIRSRPTPRQG